MGTLPLALPRSRYHISSVGAAHLGSAPRPSLNSPVYWIDCIDWTRLHKALWTREKSPLHLPGDRLSVPSPRCCDSRRGLFPDTVTISS